MPTYYDVEVMLSGSLPPVWRRFFLRADRTTFADLHRAIQDACGWLDYHLFRFDEPTPRGMVGIAQSPVDMGWDDDPTPAAAEVPLKQWAGDFLPRACSYTYDFGDDWRHDVVFRDLVRSDESFFRLLIGGSRSFPPEDCGGMMGFERVLHFRETGEDLWDDPDAGLDEWLGDWQPDVDLTTVSGRFDAKRKPRQRR